MQIVGLKSGWHAAAVMGTSQFHGVRLAHAAEMRLELLAHGRARCHVHGVPRPVQSLLPGGQVLYGLMEHSSGPRGLQSCRAHQALVL